MTSANLIEGRVHGPLGSNGTLTFETDGGIRLEVVAADPSRTGQTTVALRSSYIHLGRADGAQNTVTGRIHRRMFHGDFVQYIVECACGRLIVRRPPTNLLDEGAPVTLSFSPEHTVLLQG